MKMFNVILGTADGPQMEIQHQRWIHVGHRKGLRRDSKKGENKGEL